MADLGLPEGGLPTDLGSQRASSLLGKGNNLNTLATHKARFSGSNTDCENLISTQICFRLLSNEEAERESVYSLIKQKDVYDLDIHQSCPVE